MPNNMETILQKLVVITTHHNSIRAIGLSGGDRPLPKAGEGDIDIFVYCTQIPSTQERREILASLPDLAGTKVGKLQSGHWGQGDCFFLAGVETWLLYFTLAEARAELDAILDGQYLDRLDSYYYPIGRCAMWKTMRSLYDPDGFLVSLKGRLREYPRELAQALIAHHLQALEDVEDLERAVRRRDVFFFHFALDLALDHFLQALFALNREFFPSRKRSEMYLHGFSIKPSECEKRLRQVVALGADPKKLEQSYEIWNRLIHDVNMLAANPASLNG